MDLLTLKWTDPYKRRQRWPYADV